MERSSDWSTYQLTEFMAAVSSAKDEPAALRTAVERAAEALEAEVGALVFLTIVRASIGFPRGEVPEENLVAVAAGRQDRIEIPGVGDAPAIAVPLEVQPPGWMVLARSGDGFAPGERALLRGMARVLSLTQRMLRVVEGERTLREKTEQQARQNAQLLASLQERQRLFDRLMSIQRLISLRTPPAEIFASVTRCVRELMGDEVVALRLLDPADPERLLTVSSAGVDQDLVQATQGSPVGAGASGLAVSGDRLVVIEDYPNSALAMEEPAAAGIQAVMAAPVHENGQPVGSLTVASYTPGRIFSRIDQDVLAGLAQHASLALPEASTEERFAVTRGPAGGREGSVAA